MGVAETYSCIRLASIITLRAGDGSWWPYVIRVVLIDRLSLVRTGVRRLLRDAGDIEVVAEGTTADDAARFASERSPDILLLDGEITGAHQAIRSIKRSAGTCQIVVLTNTLHHAEAAQVTAAGASGYVCKDIPPQALITVLRALSGNGAGRRGTAADRESSHAVDFRGRSVRDRSMVNGLTARELDILAELTRGRTDQEIADKLLVGEGTVKTHIRHILHKLGVRNRTAATAYALRRRLIE